MIKKSSKKKPNLTLAKSTFRRVRCFRPKAPKPVFLRERQLPTNKHISVLVAHADDLALNAGRTVFAMARKSRKNAVHSFVLMSGQRAVLNV